jgi:putative ATP-dependent endonuclease of the OLD family
MYISKIHIKNYRNFKDQEIAFSDGVNVIIGHNNAGKTNLIKALALVIDCEGKKRLDAHDFYKDVTAFELKSSPPKVTITVYFTGSGDIEKEKDDISMMGEWLVDPNPPSEAALTYEFHLPSAEHDAYKRAVKDIPDNDTDTIWRVLQHDFIRHYKSRITGGKQPAKTHADWDAMRKFDFQFLDAIRDVERDMRSGRDVLLRDVLDFFMDYEVKSLSLDQCTRAEKEEKIRVIRQDFAQKSSDLMDILHSRMATGKGQILAYVTETGAAFDGAKPDFDGLLSDIELFAALRLIVEHSTGIKVPATHNGLGYNNLIYMSLLLAKMQMNSDANYMGGNSKVFAVLAIEEPEAHLHPAMQYKFLKFLRQNRAQKRVRQVFVTTHSAHITSAVSLDEIICLDNRGGSTHVSYPGKVFPDAASKGYVQRFLDATKSEMLFAKSVLLVEGMAEQLLMSTLATYHGKSLEDSHVATVNVGGRYFNHFLHLFSPTSKYAMRRKVACVTDRDPEKEDGDKYHKCYPFEVSKSTGKYKYNEVAAQSTNGNISYFSQNATLGKTLEYDLVRFNPTLELLITDTMSNQPELKKLMQHVAAESSIEDMLAELHAGKQSTKIIAGISAQDTWDIKDRWDIKEKRIAIVAARYLNSVGKGENALQLAFKLAENLEKPQNERHTFNVPDYLKSAIDWVTE